MILVATHVNVSMKHADKDIRVKLNNNHTIFCIMYSSDIKKDKDLLLNLNQERMITYDAVRIVLDTRMEYLGVTRAKKNFAHIVIYDYLKHSK